MPNITTNHAITYTNKDYFWYEKDDCDFGQYVLHVRLHLMSLVIPIGGWVNLQRAGGGGVVKKRVSRFQISRSWHLCDYVEVPGGYSPIKVTGVLVIPFRGLNLGIGTAQGAKTENDCCQSCLGTIYDNTFQKFLGRKCSKVVFSTIKICSKGGNEFWRRP